MKIDQALKDMKEAVLVNKPVSKEAIEVEAKETPETEEIALIEPYSRKGGRKKLIDDRMRAILLKLAEKYFFYDAICARAGIYRQRLTEELSRNKEFGRSFAYARHKFIAHHQDLLIQYSTDKREKDWRAEKYILTIADKEYSERKYLTDAVSNQDAKILLQIKAEQLTIASQAGKEMLKTVITTPLQPNKISLLPFKEVATKKKNVKNKG